MITIFIYDIYHFLLNSLQSKILHTPIYPYKHELYFFEYFKMDLQETLFLLWETQKTWRRLFKNSLPAWFYHDYWKSFQKQLIQNIKFTKMSNISKSKLSIKTVSYINTKSDWKTKLSAMYVTLCYLYKRTLMLIILSPSTSKLHFIKRYSDISRVAFYKKVLRHQ